MGRKHKPKLVQRQILHRNQTATFQRRGHAVRLHHISTKGAGISGSVHTGVPIENEINLTLSVGVPPPFT